MTMLHRKVWREMIRSWGQYLAVVLVTAIGIGLFVATLVAYADLKLSTDAYYRQYRFAHLSARLAYAPASLADHLEQIPGILAATGRIVTDIAVLHADGEERLAGKLISLPEGRVDRVNALYLYQGRSLPRQTVDGALLESRFAATASLQPGDQIEVIIGRRLRPLRLWGLVGSPEYVIAIPDVASFAGEGKYPILFVQQSLAQDLLEQPGAINDIAILTDPRSDEEAVVAAVRAALEPYGLQEIIRRKDQLSNALLQSELTGLEAIAWMFPILFLSVMALVLFVLVTRVVKNQRGQVGVLQALGYSRRAIVMHYLTFALVAGTIGALAGNLAGVWLGKQMTALYLSYFNIPVRYIVFHPAPLVWAMVVGLLFSGAAGLTAVWSLIRLRPAEALRPEAPPPERLVCLEYLPALWNRLGSGWRLAVRNSVRQRQRTLFSALGIGVTVALLVVTLFFTDATDHMLGVFFTENHPEDLKVTFAEFQPLQVMTDLDQLPGVKRAEPVLEVPVALRHGWREETVVLQGYRPGSALTPLQPAPGGILLPENLAKRLGVRPGSRVQAQVKIGRKQTADLPVRDTYVQVIGTGAVMPLDTLGSLADTGPAASAALLQVDPGARAGVKAELARWNGVRSVEDRQDMRDAVEVQLRLMNVMVGVFSAFAMVMGFAIVFNTGTVTFLERQRELVGMRLLGLTAGEVAAMLLREVLVTAVLGATVGLPLGVLLAHVYAARVGSELFSLQVVVYPRTYAWALGLAAVFLAVSHWVQVRRLHGLSLVESISTQAE